MPCIFLGQGYSSEERDFWPFKFQLLTVQNKAFELGHIEQVYEVGIMVLVACPIDYNVIVDAYDTRALFHDDVHLHLKYILGHFGTKWHSLESIPPLVSVDH